MYAAHCMANRGLKFQRNTDAIVRAQRLAAVRVTRCYKTVSADAALFLAEIPPGDLLAWGRNMIRKRRAEDQDERNGMPQAAELAAEARHLTMAEWQTRSDSRTRVARWTRRILPSVTR